MTTMGDFNSAGKHHREDDAVVRVGHRATCALQEGNCKASDCPQHGWLSQSEPLGHTVAYSAAQTQAATALERAAAKTGALLDQLHLVENAIADYKNRLRVLVDEVAAARIEQGQAQRAFLESLGIKTVSM